ncbi:MAG: HEAT repeat domain-containing protein, partial [Deltaproteobacteria bacterium]|nr:HEAT repeat domain-containing protein [Deltaproteobacteria bacterium]
MTLILIYLTIAATGLLILFTLTAVLVRRAYMRIRYARLDEARAMFAGLSERIDPDAGSIDLNQYRKKPGTLEWQAIEEALFKSLDTLNVGAHSSSLSLQALQGPAQKTLKLFDALGFTDYYIDRLIHGSRWDKALAADKLGRTGCGKAVPHLAEALNSNYRDVRNLSVYALGLIHDKSVIPRLMELIRRASGKTQEDFSARIVKSALISFGQAAVPALIEEQSSPVWQVRASCVDILGEIPCPEVRHALRNALKDPEQDVRAKAAKGAGKLKDRGALAGLIALLADPHWVVRLHAARALGLIGDINAIPHIKARLNDENWQVRRVAAESLGRFGGAAYPALMEVSLKDSDRYAREQADDEL